MATHQPVTDISYTWPSPTWRRVKTTTDTHGTSPPHRRDRAPKPPMR
jgi:hypothetical protein